jgi:hypothetical protein
MLSFAFRRPTFNCLKSNGHPAIAGPLSGKQKNKQLCDLCASNERSEWAVKFGLI